MGLLIAHRIAPSPVHGTGLFTVVALEAGTPLWCYEPGLEQRRRLADLLPGESQRLLHHGYINPERPGWLVICGDDARFWNFPPPGRAANCVLGDRHCAGEAVVVAARAIAAGEELLIEPTSDADYHRKLGLRLQAAGPRPLGLQLLAPPLQASPPGAAPVTVPRGSGQS